MGSPHLLAEKLTKAFQSSVQMTMSSQLDQILNQIRTLASVEDNNSPLTDRLASTSTISQCWRCKIIGLTVRTNLSSRTMVIDHSYSVIRLRHALPA